MSLDSLIENKLNTYAKKMADGGAKVDEHAVGQLYFYTTLRRAISDDATPQDVGLLDAINDTLQELGVVKSGEVFYRN